MKYWFWICLELLIMLGTGVWVYFFPEEALAKGVVGFGLLWLVEECKEINRRNKMSEELRVEVIERNGEFEVGIAYNSDLGISVDLSGHQGHGKTKEEAIEDFKKNIFELSEEVECVKNRLLANIYIVQGV